MFTALLTADEAARLAPGGQLVIVRAGDNYGSHLPHVKYAGPQGYGEGFYVAPQDWVALTGPCPTCDPQTPGKITALNVYPCPDCRDGRRIVPLHELCPEFNNHVGSQEECDYCCDDQWRVLVGRGSIAVVPVVGLAHYETFDRLVVLADGTAVLVLPDAKVSIAVLTLDPLPVPGRDWGIIIDCVEVIA